MEIQATGQLNVRTLQAVNGLALCGKRDPRKHIRNHLILIAVCVGIVLLSELLMLSLGDSLPPWLFIGLLVCVLLSLFTPYQYYIVPKRQYKKLGTRADMVSVYLFRENDIHITAEGAEGLRAEETIPYTALHAFKETNAYLFLYADKLHVFPIDKQSMTAADIDTVRARLQAAVPYTLCNY